MVAAVAFVIGIGIGLRWGPFSSRHGGAIRTAPIAHHVGVDAVQSAMASNEMMTPTPPDAPAMPTDAPDTIDAELDAAPRNAILLVPDPGPLMLDAGVGKQTQPNVPSKRRPHVQDGSRHKVVPSPSPVDPFGSPD